MTEITWASVGGLPEPEFHRLRRRRSSAEYKLRILREADECATPGEVGALLRRERLYMSHLTYWRAEHEAGALHTAGRPRPPVPTNEPDGELAELRRRLERVEGELEDARTVIAMHGELAALLEDLRLGRSPGPSTRC